MNNARRPRSELPPGVALREMRDDDVDAIVDLSIRAWEPVFASFLGLLGPRLFGRFYPDWKSQQASDVRAALAANLTWVGLCDGAVAGFVNVIMKTDDRAVRST
jgi:hypothetical protein